jgi:hypothetical protein
MSRPQFAAPAIDAGLDGAERDAERFGNLFVASVLDIAQHQDGTKFLGQFFHAGHEEGHHLTAGGLLAGGGALCGVLAGTCFPHHRLSAERPATRSGRFGARWPRCGFSKSSRSSCNSHVLNRLSPRNCSKCLKTLTRTSWGHLKCRFRVAPPTTPGRCDRHDPDAPRAGHPSPPNRRRVPCRSGAFPDPVEAAPLGQTSLRSLLFRCSAVSVRGNGPQRQGLGWGIGLRGGNSGKEKRTGERPRSGGPDGMGLRCHLFLRLQGFLSLAATHFTRFTHF